MTNKNMVVVTYNAGTEERAVFRDILENKADIFYLEGFSDTERKKVLAEADVISSCSFSRNEIYHDEIRYLSRTRFIQLTFSGADNVPFEKIPPGITLASNPGAFAEPIAEHTLALALSCAKNIIPKHRKLSEEDFDQSGFNTLLKGKICGIVGFGGNGKAIAHLFRAIGMKIYGINRSGKSDQEIDFLGTPEDLHKVLRESDIVIISIPATLKTQHLIGRHELSLMKKDAILINVARGSVIDQQALYEHMKDNPFFRAGIDTWWSEPDTHGSFSLDHPFFDLENLVGSPHIADVVRGMMPSATRRAAENIRAFLHGEKVSGILHHADYIR